MPDSLLSKLRGPFNFLTPGLEEVPLHFPELEGALPTPVPIFLGDGSTSPVYGYPVFNAPGLSVLDASLRDFLLAEERFQVARIDPSRLPDFKLAEHQEAWTRYRDVLIEVSTNVMTSNFGRRFPELFWLHQSGRVARALKSTPGRIRELDLELGRARGDALRYSVLFSVLEKVFSALFDLAARLAARTNQHEDQLFPSLLTRMRDNVLVFTEDHVGKDLKELASYFRGYLKIDGRDLLYRFALLRKWHREVHDEDPRLRSAGRGWATITAQIPDPDILLFRPHYVEHLLTLEGYRHDEFLTAKEAHLWSALCVRLKEFEVLNAVRKLITPIEFRDGHYRCDANSASRLGAGSVAKAIDPQTRPYDFTARWIVDPEVSRSGLIYDIRNFSSIVSILRLSERQRQTEAFQQFLIFQHRIETIVHKLHLHSEKYLGDGAFFSGRDAVRVLSAAIQIQRAYTEALDAGLPFDEGMRIAINHASYHLLPLGSGEDPGSAGRYEVYGHGLVELSRLVSGKRGFDVDEVKSVLVGRGYDADSVEDFFRPLAERSEGASAPGAFRARLDGDRKLVNDGIVATLPFLQRIDAQFEGGLKVVDIDGAPFVAVRYRLEQREEKEAFHVGFRRLGTAAFKGLEQLPIFEVLDLRDRQLGSTRIASTTSLLEAVESAYTSSRLGND